MLWTAFILGLVGSLHCAGMCGPLVLAIPATGQKALPIALGRLAYNGGRILTYCFLGSIFGLAGGGLALAGISRWISIATGIAILSGLLLSVRGWFSLGIADAGGWLRRQFGRFLRRRTFSGGFLLGMINGLLPCGLVYAACAVAVTAGGLAQGAAYMGLFGLGTVPMMLGIGLFGASAQFKLRMRFERVIPICLTATAVLLILRGMALGIPYLSPEFGSAHHGCCAAGH